MSSSGDVNSNVSQTKKRVKEAELDPARNPSEFRVQLVHSISLPHRAYVKAVGSSFGILQQQNNRVNYHYSPSSRTSRKALLVDESRITFLALVALAENMTSSFPFSRNASTSKRLAHTLCVGRHPASKPN